MKKGLKIALFVIVGLILLGIIIPSGKESAPPGGTGAPQQPAQTQPAQPVQSEPEKPALEVLEAKSETGEFGVRYIAGKVRNNANRTYSYVQVEINLYDDAGNQVGSTLANTNNLEPGQVWAFRAVILESRATKFKVVRVTGW